jgi:hypothetical protein
MERSLSFIDGMGNYSGHCDHFVTLQSSFAEGSVDFYVLESGGSFGELIITRMVDFADLPYNGNLMSYLYNSSCDDPNNSVYRNNLDSDDELNSMYFYTDVVQGVATSYASASFIVSHEKNNSLVIVYPDLVSDIPWFCCDITYYFNKTGFCEEFIPLTQDGVRIEASFSIDVEQPLPVIGTIIDLRKSSFLYESSLLGFLSTTNCKFNHGGSPYNLHFGSYSLVDDIWYYMTTNSNGSGHYGTGRPYFFHQNVAKSVIILDPLTDDATLCCDISWENGEMLINSSPSLQIISFSWIFSSIVNFLLLG